MSGGEQPIAKPGIRFLKARPEDSSYCQYLQDLRGSSLTFASGERLANFLIKVTSPEATP
jgi:hypothetical protein